VPSGLHLLAQARRLVQLTVSHEHPQVDRGDARRRRAGVDDRPEQRPDLVIPALVLEDHRLRVHRLDEAGPSLQGGVEMSVGLGILPPRGVDLPQVDAQLGIGRLKLDRSSQVLDRLVAAARRVGDLAEDRQGRGVPFIASQRLLTERGRGREVAEAKCGGGLLCEIGSER
jgi:hypothetical protein